jgi:hypothetical protein
MFSDLNFLDVEYNKTFHGGTEGTEATVIASLIKALIQD